MRHAIWSVLLALGCSTPTPLHGSISCDGFGAEMTCGDGQVCIPGRATPDDGGIPATCVNVPVSCVAYDCTGTDCPDCVLRLCPYYPDYVQGTELHGRTLRCP